jgi:CoA-transferase family III
MDLSARFSAAPAPGVTGNVRDAATWARSGAMGLSGEPDGPILGPPRALLARVSGLGAALRTLSGRLGNPVDIDGVAMLGERAAIANLGRRGRVSCGGATRLVKAGKQWIAVTLAREADFELVPAWLNSPVPGNDPDVIWEFVIERARCSSADALVERATLVGLACARLGEIGRHAPAASATRRGEAASAQRLEHLVVVDLSSLWAGPLCANLLGLGGARVIKVESEQRPDGARRGPQMFFDLLHGGHEGVALDFRRPADLQVLRRLIARSDVVIEASRPRALAQLGITMDGLPGPAVWVSLSGYGHHGPSSNRVAYGDDAAVAGGLVTWGDDGPAFCADAVADPVTGLLAAAVVLDRLIEGGRWNVDLGLAPTARWCSAGPAIRLGGESADPPRHRPLVARAPELGEHTDSVLRSFGITR